MTDYIMNFTDPLSGSFVIKPYTSNGAKFPTTTVRPSSSTVSNSPLLLYGKGHADYGERTDENLLHLAENFAGASKPKNAIAGMLWFRRKLYFRDTSGSPADWYRWNGSSWSAITVTESATFPVTPTNGQLHFITTGSPGGGTLYRYSDDEREIQSWLEREYDTGPYNPNVGTGSPLTAFPLTEELVVYNGTSWDTSDILQTGAGLSASISALNAVYIRRDGSNSPTANISWGSNELTDVSRLETNDIDVLSGGDIDVESGNVTLSDGFVRVENAGGASLQFENAGGSTGNWTIQQSGSNVFQVQYEGTSVLEIAPSGSPDASIVRVTNPNYEDYVINPNDVPNKRYVDEQVAAVSAGSPLPDNYVIEAGSSFSVGTLTLATTGAHPDAPSIDIPGFNSDEIPYISGLGSPFTSVTVDDALVDLETTKAPLFSPVFTGLVTVPTPSTPTDATTKAYVDAEIASVASGPNARLITTVGSGSPVGSPLGLGSPGVYTVPSYEVGANKLMVFADGLKQYASSPGFVDATYITSITASTVTNFQTFTVVGVLTGSPSVWIIAGNNATLFSSITEIRITGNTGGANGVYTVDNAVDSASPFVTYVQVSTPIPGTATSDGTLNVVYRADISIDGGGPQTIEVDASTAGTFSLLTTTMSGILVGGSVFIFGGAIRIQSNSSPYPGPSTVSVTDGSGNEALFLNSTIGFASFETTNANGLSLAYDEIGTTGAPSTLIQETKGPGSAWSEGTVLEFLVVN